MPFPKTKAELVKAGYIFNKPGTCTGRRCKAAIEWWITPTGKDMPMDPMPKDDSEATPHWGTCPDRVNFKR